MKELLSFFSNKTKSLVGQQFVRLQGPEKSTRTAQEALAFLAESYNAVGPDTDLPRFVAECEKLNLIQRVVAYEGAFSAAICLDVSHPREHARAVEMADLAPAHVAALGLGTGHALARLRVEADITLPLSEHYLGWMAMDAYGMHEGYFHWFDSVQNMRVPLKLPPLAMAAFDQGLGRALFFIANGDAHAVQQLLERFPVARRSSLWRGIGLMVGFWGTDDELQMTRLLKFSKEFRPYFQQGAAQGVSLRVDWDDVIDHTKASAELICKASVNEVADVSSACMAIHTGDTFDTRSYVNWQNELVKFFANGDLK
ncbi:MAG: DUF1702 family protein [Candidatus Obscuribacterales bacterium]|nr:DUF1702 family protein [Candidatus Obscuribacterales bacterium]